jgi:hypothetical protein
MGFRKSWDPADIANQIRSLSRECSSLYNDGFTSFECKKDLLLIKKLVDDALADAPNFGEMEERWLKEQEQKRIIKILKEK